jgi:magnesium chelatase family protein
MLVASMNPCPCGHFGTANCRCSPSQIQRYLNRISGPLLDRIDMHVEMGPVTYSQIADTAVEEPSCEVKARVNKARAMQQSRFKDYGIHCNSQMDMKLSKKFCTIDKDSQSLIKRAFTSMGMSARAYWRILKVARTIADLSENEQIQTSHIAEAIQYRSLDRKYWGV